MLRSLCLIVCIGLLAAGCSTTKLGLATDTPTTPTVGPTKTPIPFIFPTYTPRPTPIPYPVSEADLLTFEKNRMIGRAVNLGNALEAPTEGEWGVTLEERYFDLIKDAGFNAIRVPIRWSAHALAEPPYTIEPAFFERVDWVVENASRRDLVVILNMHHYLEIFEEPVNQQERFNALWEQIAKRYQDQPETVYFELLNEPSGALSPFWNGFAAKALAIVRKSNPDRTVVIGPGDWNNIPSLDSLKLPDADRNIIVTVHYYSPFHFTHQGAEWADGSEAWLGTKWQASDAEKTIMENELRPAYEWSKKNGRPIFLGEFGSYSKADMDSRALWTNAVAQTAEKFEFSWAYWEFCSGFGVYDLEKDAWNDPLVLALLP
jgi:endoglucanase